ncbi:MAG: signal peptide peptidase SppA [Elusimicrobiota bacterium]
MNEEEFPKDETEKTPDAAADTAAAAAKESGPDEAGARGENDRRAEPEKPPEPRLMNRRASDLHPIKRRLVMSLVGLYAVSVIAAAAVLWRSQSMRSGGDGKGIDLKPVAGMLANKDAVGMLTISGPIYRSEGGRMFERGVQQWGRHIEKLAKKKEVKAIVISINSPGGSVGAVQELYDTILRVKKEHKKPVVAHLGDVAASGGYYLAITCDHIVAHPGTLLGSIGVIFSNVNVEGLLTKVGIKSRVIKSGKMKDIGSMSRPMTEEERALMQELIDNAYAQFLGAVVKGRKQPASKIRPLADGRIFTGQQALELGLIDSLGDSHAAVMLAAKLGGIKDAEPRIIRGSDGLSNFMELLDSRWGGLFSARSAALQEFKQWGYHGLEYRW